MLDFIAQYGPMITMGLTALSSLGIAIYNFKQVLTMGKKVDENVKNTNQGINITQQGIIEAFKTAKIPTEWKIDVSNKINNTLGAWEDKILSVITSKLAKTNELLMFALTILNNTAAAGKLTEAQQGQLDELLNEVQEEDKTITLA